MVPYTDDQLLGIFQSADPTERDRALEYLYTLDGGHIKKAIVRHVCGKGGSPADGEDVCHDAFIVARKNFIEGKFRGQCPLKNYIIKIGEWTWWNMRRKSKPILGLDAELARLVEHSVEEHLLRKEKSELLDKAIALLPAKCREVLRLRRDGHPVKNIGVLLNHTNEKQTENRLYRCQDRLREILKTLQ